DTPTERGATPDTMDDGNNLASGGTCGCSTAAVENAGDPGASGNPVWLGPLVANPGPANTSHPSAIEALCTGMGSPDPACTGVSPAIGAGAASNHCPSNDQRGVPRHKP